MATSAAKANRNADIVDRLEAEIDRLRAALKDAREIISNYWPLSTPEAEPEKSTLAALKKIDDALHIQTDVDKRIAYYTEQIAIRYQVGFVNGYRKALLDHGIDPNADNETAALLIQKGGKS